MATDDSGQDPDRAVILARRRHFVALALSGLTTAGCKHQPEPCLSIAQPTDGEVDDGPSPDGPFVEDPGVPVAEPEQDPESEGELEPEPQPCLEMVAPTPRPCLKKKPSPRVCLLIID